jgi:hypothetical protein
VPPWHPRHAAFAAAGAKRGSKGAARAQAREVATRAQPRETAQQGKPPALGGRGWEHGAPSQQEPPPLPLPLSHRHQVGSSLACQRSSCGQHVFLRLVMAATSLFHQDKEPECLSACQQYQVAHSYTRSAFGTCRPPDHATVQGQRRRTPGVSRQGSNASSIEGVPVREQLQAPINLASLSGCGTSYAQSLTGWRSYIYSHRLLSSQTKDIPALMPCLMCIDTCIA